MKRPKIAKDLHPIGTCSACSSLVFKRNRRIILTCECVTSLKPFQLKIEGRVLGRNLSGKTIKEGEVVSVVIGDAIGVYGDIS